MKRASSVASFKYRQNRNLQAPTKPTKYFSADTNIGKIIHARFRMQCSALNSYLNRKNIVSSHSCQFGSFKNIVHSFFVCPNYAEARESYSPDDYQSYTVNELILCPEYETVQENGFVIYNCKILLFRDLYKMTTLPV